MKIINLLFAPLILLSSCLAEHPLVDTINYDTAEKLQSEIENNAKIGIEIEYGVHFIREQSKKFKYFNKGEIIGTHSTHQFRLEADYITKNDFSDIECVSNPITFSEDGLIKLQEVSEYICKYFVTLSEASDTKLNLRKAEYERSNKVLNGNEILNYINSHKEICLEQYLNKIDLSEFNNHLLEGENVYSLAAPDYTLAVPQITCPLSLAAIFRIVKNYTLKIRDGESYPKFIFYDLYLRYENIEREASKLLGSEFHTIYNNEEASGFLCLVILYLDQFKSSREKSYISTLKNSLPIINSRNDFGLLFKLLPKHIQNLLSKNDGEIFKKLTNLFFSDSSLDKLNSPLVERKILCRSSQKEKYIIQDLSISHWLETITKGTDLLVKDNYQKEFPNASQEDLLNLETCFGNFGNRVEYINGKPCGIFEWRVNPTLDFYDIPSYILNIAKFLYEENKMTD